MPEWLMRAVYRVGYRVLRVWWRVAHPVKRGVVFVGTRGDEVLLIRHTYGRRWQWDLPGGGKKRTEDPADAVRREVHEELGVEIEPVFLGQLFAQIGGKHDELWLFTAEVADTPLEPSRVEIEEARWFPRGALPTDRARYVDRIMERISDRRT